MIDGALAFLSLVTIAALLWGCRQRAMKNVYYRRLQALNYQEAELERFTESIEEEFSLYERLKTLLWRLRMRREYPPLELERPTEQGGDRKV